MNAHANKKQFKTKKFVVDYDNPMNKKQISYENSGG